MHTITVVIHTYNEETNITDCIISAKHLTDDIVVIDMKSTDRTVLLAKKHGVVTHSFPHMLYVEPARKFGIQKARGEWVCILDADERITKNLAQEIQGMIDGKYTHYSIPRKNIFVGKKWLQHGGWWPDYQVRLIKKSALLQWSKHIHSQPHIEGEKGYFKNPMLHLFHPSIHNMVNKTVIYEDIESSLLYAAERKVAIRTFFRKFSGELMRRLIVKRGFLDGSLGIIESVYQAYSKTITWLLLYEKRE